MIRVTAKMSSASKMILLNLALKKKMAMRTLKERMKTLNLTTRKQA
jgi:hypothetical protein